jgi:4-amino-4-deoxy-L-arabinose transferase-like glycosyltransferase
MTKSRDDIRLRVDLETALLLIMLGMIFIVRITNLNFNSLFVDEAANLLAGHDALLGRFDRNIASWFGGSYLYPLIATAADSLGGVWGARLVSAFLTTATAFFVYLAAQRLFERQTALWAMSIYGLTGASISLGQMAVYDVLCLPFLALTFYLLIEALHRQGRSEQKYWLAAGLSFGMGVLGKYTAIFYLPALALLAAAFLIVRSRRGAVLRSAVCFLLPAGLLIGGYVLYFFKDLMLVFTTQGYQLADRREIFQVIWDEIGTTILLAVAGAFGLLVTAAQSNQSNPASAVNVISTFLRSRRKFIPTVVLLVIFILFLLIPAFLTLPLYQLATANIRSVWKNTISSLIFLAPLAGYAVAASIRAFQFTVAESSLRYRLIGAGLTLLGVFWFANHALDRNWGFQNSWTNVTGAVEYITAHGFGDDSRILVEGGAAFEYYFGVGNDSRGLWADTWYMRYQGYEGVDAMTAAIHDRQLDFVVLDGEHTPDVQPLLAAALTESGYTIGYEEVQALSVGNRTVRVYVKPVQQGAQLP